MLIRTHFFLFFLTLQIGFNPLVNFCVFITFFFVQVDFLNRLANIKGGLELYRLDLYLYVYINYITPSLHVEFITEIFKLIDYFWSFDSKILQNFFFLFNLGLKLLFAVTPEQEMFIDQNSKSTSHVVKQNFIDFTIYKFNMKAYK